MGWSGSLATRFKNGRVDRKAEVDALFDWQNEQRKVSVVASRMKGTTYYGAIRSQDLTTHKDDIVGVVVLTRIDRRDGYFMTKVMEETAGPYYYEAPKSILKQLSPTTDENAIQWRQQCWKLAKGPKLSSCKEGDVIEFTLPYDTRLHKKGEVIRLQKRLAISRPYGRNTCRWKEVDSGIIWPSSLIPKVFEVVIEKEREEKE